MHRSKLRAYSITVDAGRTATFLLSGRSFFWRKSPARSAGLSDCQSQSVRL